VRQLLHNQVAALTTTTAVKSADNDIRKRTADRIALLAVGASTACVGQVVIYVSWGNMVMKNSRSKFVLPSFFAN
jgi:hypothetical protein